MVVDKRRASTVSTKSEVWYNGGPNSDDSSDKELSGASEAEPERAPEHRESARQEKELAHADLKVRKTRSARSVAFEDTGPEPISLEEEVVVTGKDRVSRRDVIHAVQRCMGSLNPAKAAGAVAEDPDGDRELSWDEMEARVRAERLATQGEPKTPPVSPVSPRSPTLPSRNDEEEPIIVENDTLTVKALRRSLSQRSQSLPPRALHVRDPETVGEGTPSPQGGRGALVHLPQRHPAQSQDASPRRAGRPLSAWSVEDVVQWVKEVAGCPAEVAELLRQQAVNGLVLMSLSEQDLETMGIAKFGWRRQLTLLARAEEAKAVRPLPQMAMTGPPAPPAAMPQVTSDAYPPPPQRAVPCFAQPLRQLPLPPSFQPMPGKSLAFAPASQPSRQTLFARCASPPPGPCVVTRQSLPPHFAWLHKARPAPVPWMLPSGQVAQAPIFLRHASPPPRR